MGSSSRGSGGAADEDSHSSQRGVRRAHRSDPPSTSSSAAARRKGAAAGAADEKDGELVDDGNFQDREDLGGKDPDDAASGDEDSLSASSILDSDEEGEELDHVYHILEMKGRNMDPSDDEAED